MEITEVSARAVSAALFGPYVLAVELGSFLLLAGLISAYHIAKR
jgi:NADH-quinone oxidoreductase subunit J